MQSAKNKYQANKPKVKARGSVAQVMRRPAVKVVDIPKDYKSKINEKLVECYGRCSQCYVAGVLSAMAGALWQLLCGR